MARKNKLDSSVESANAIIGIATPFRDYKLVHYLNQHLELSLASVDDLPVYQAKTDSISYHTFYMCHHPDLRTDFYLTANYNGSGYMIPSLRQINYFLLIQGAAYQHHIDDLTAVLRKIQGIQAAIPVNQSAVKEFSPLLEDLELHKLDLQKAAEEKNTLNFSDEL